MTAVRGSDVLEASQVRIYSSAGRVIGAGFLVAADVVCTCAHVVARALGVSDGAEQGPGEPVVLDFPLLAGRPRARASVVSWRRGGIDVALLRLDAAVEGARPVQLVDGTGVWGHTFRAFGYPARADNGVWAAGTLHARQGSGWLQMEAQEPGPRIEEGFSGSPVWDDVQDGVVGMTVAAERGDRTAYLLPSAELIDERTLPPVCPFKGLEAFTEDDAEFFHGRDRDIARVHAAVRGRAVTLVAGPSGCGKSSLVRAGVLPRMRAEGMSVSELRPVPGVRAAAVLARGLIGVLEPGLGEVQRLTKAEELAGLLETADDVPTELRGRLLARGERAGHVIFVDQLEELAAAEPSAARDLFGLLTALAGKDGAAVLRIVATVRPDSLDELVTAGTSDLVSDAVQFLAALAAEDLGRAVTAPVDAVPGLWFEPGLPERIVADAGNEPGRMPLVQFALTELWKRRTRSMLTHAAYDDLDGVVGALVGYADDALAGLTQTQQDCARRLFVQLARPSDGDTFSRRPTRTTDLAPELLELARQLAPTKLVVLSPAPGGAGREEIVDLAHEALTRLWPRLRQWLLDSRDLRLWQEQVRADLRRWQEQHREPARLLSGGDLAEADRRLAEHPEDVSADERAYIQLSRRHARRGARLRQAAVGALAVLTVLAVVLALSTYQSLKETEEQLRTQAAGLLAQAADDRPGSDPATALQLALAAYETKDTAKTRQALLNQYARGQYLVGSYPSVWRGWVTGMDATPDARTLVVQSKPGGGNRSTIHVVTGALQGKPRARKLSGVPEGVLKTALSPDGRFFAATAGEGVRLWRLSDPQHPQVLDLDGRDLPEKAGGTLDFSSDGKRLLRTTDDHSVECANDTRRCIPAFAEAWHVPSGTRIDVPDRLVPETGLNEAAFTSDANTVVTVSYIDDDLRERIEIRDFTTGRLRYTSTVQDGAASLLAGGESIVRSQGTTKYGQALGRTPGRKTKLPHGGTWKLDATSRYAVDNASSYSSVGSVAGYAETAVTDLRTGRTYRARIPTSGDAPKAYDRVAVVPGSGGELTVLVPVGTALMAVRAQRAGSGQLQEEHGTGKYAVSPDGRFVARATDRRLEVLDASRTRHRSVPLPSPPDTSDWIPAWTADSTRIVVWSEHGNLYRSYAVQNLSDSVPLDDVVPKAKELDGVTVLRGGEVDSVTALRGSEIVLLTVDGRLTLVDAADAAVHTRPFLVHPAPNWAGIGFTNEISARGQLLARPGHPGQVAVVTRTGNLRGEILLWDVRAPRRITTLSVPGITVPYSPESLAGALAFDADGSHLAVQNPDGRVRVWDLDRRKQLARSTPSTVGDILVGFGPGDSVVTYLSNKSRIQIHDLMGDGTSVTVPVAGDWTTGLVQGHRLTIDTGAVRQTFDLRPSTQFRTLCTAAGRDYTKAERKLLPEGTPSKPPCS
ncbi:trypsin-like peptidase domain-containing protein [Streptomyces africanus]|uniref:nSTAND1 domain-containing NTPase n=1 Tax=Streptomyces africanus TaxID=231024 RepID=UPI001302A406|nr:trypsin-like peptidase domain-containing protein [Streptomyces africanus]